MLHKRFTHDKDGATAVEFALITPVLVVLAFAAIEFGLIFYCHTTAGHAAWDTTRQLATNRIKPGEVEAKAREQLPAWMRASATITQTSTSPDPYANRYTVTVAFPATAASATGVVSWAYGNLTLTSKITMQQEPTS
ncbi:TadE/TadG family type IV pilus assembly protein [Methylobacterium iners]|uniref:TadE-like domain-containing protein n=1 Tax=Methylobacterium iners TaxID=418707 RepID=A0ABQ4RSH9_9HYPH|nr:TadE/TadG family type IV pilus assembly protein [Methylobacterium iners]GJD93154.1 hypothetical protein OCOJLMKI_0344 [Methylobacterium iners]